MKNFSVHVLFMWGHLLLLTSAHISIDAQDISYQHREAHIKVNSAHMKIALHNMSLHNIVITHRAVNLRHP